MDIHSSQTALNDVEIRLDSEGQKWIVVGVFGFLLLVVLSLAIPLDVPSLPLSFCIAFVIVGIWRRKTPLAVFREDHFKIKLAPAAGHHNVLYSEVVRIETTRKHLLIEYRTHNSAAGAAHKRIKIPLKVLKEPERMQLLEAFHARLPKALFDEP